MWRLHNYSADLAYIHHAGFTQFASDACPGLLQILKRSRITGGVLVDLGCGSGIWARVAQAAGFEVLGIDASPAMIKIAKRVAPAVKFHCASLYQARLPRCRAITAIGEGFTYFIPGQRNLTLAQLFRRWSNVLLPGGVLIFDLIVTGTPSLDKRSWHSGQDWAVLTDTREFPSSRRLVRTMITFRKADARYRRGQETHHVRVFAADEVVGALRGAGFIVRTVRQYGKLKMYPRRLGFVCRKAQTPHADGKVRGRAAVSAGRTKLLNEQRAVRGGRFR
jgi:SAM-dependent methyltransferase